MGEVVSVVVEVEAGRRASTPVFVEASGTRGRWWFGVLAVCAVVALVCIATVCVVAVDSAHALGCRPQHSVAHDVAASRCR